MSKGIYIDGLGFVREDELNSLGDVFLSLPPFSFVFNGNNVYVRGGRGQEENLAAQILMPITGTADMNRWTGDDFAKAIDIISKSSISDRQKGRWSNIVIKVARRLKLGGFLERLGKGSKAVVGELSSLPVKLIFGISGAIVFLLVGFMLVGKFAGVSANTPWGKVKLGGKNEG